MSLSQGDLEEVILALKKYGTKYKAAQELGLSIQTFCYRLKKATEKIDLKVLEGQALKGISSYQVRNDDGDWEETRRWVKTDKQQEQMLDVIRDMIDGLKEETPRYEPKKFNESFREDICQVIPIGDAHVGMYAWAEESGQEWDLEIAERHMCFAFDYLQEYAEPADTCFIFNVGDYFHYSKMEATTDASGHVLDAAGRPQNMYKTGLRIMRYGIEQALKKHNKVEVKNASGNHDGLLAFTMSEALAMFYENEPRVTVDTTPKMRLYTSFGENLFGVVHGHQTKDAALPLTMANEQAELWGGTTHRRWYRGHHHHDAETKYGKEYSGCFVEQVRTLAEADAYSAGGAYLSGNDMKRYCYHKDGSLEDFSNITGKKIRRLLK